MSSPQAPPSHLGSHHDCLPDLSDESMARMEAACKHKRADMILKIQRLGTTGFLSPEQIGQVIELVKDCQRAENILKQYSLAKIDKLGELLSIELLRYLCEAGLERIAASSPPGRGTINHGHSSPSQLPGVDTTDSYYPWLTETRRIASPSGAGEWILNSPEDCVPASPSSEGHNHVQSAEAQLAAEVCILSRLVQTSY